eukprot:TRINITY_DN69525_c0_g1_i1.p1 TRINITY_DN69525_c0_g1~~TRINITY_DN69525_c0_g1_i1.p1  ORF type:complete len:762 (-),score=58.93 TRINITY_DN69525_c0_g1_i1:8-2263(-)
MGDFVQAVLDVARSRCRRPPKSSIRTVLEQAYHTKTRTAATAPIHQQIADAADSQATESPHRCSSLYCDINVDLPKCMSLTINIMLVGSRGDVQPFIVLALKLKQLGHRVRITTHEVFRAFVSNSGIEFFPIGGDPKELMAFMVENPSMIILSPTKIDRKLAVMAEIFSGAWASCTTREGCTHPYQPDLIISNPPVGIHCHIAERLQVPMVMMFTMPWTVTAEYPHPFSVFTINNRESYNMLEEMIWLGLGGLVNEFRNTVLHLPQVADGANLVRALQIPHIYLYSPALLPKPLDWGPHIHVTGFIFEQDTVAETYSPPELLSQFLSDRSKPIVYIGFGSVPVQDPDTFSQTLFEAVKIANVRAILATGWAALPTSYLNPDVFVLQACPHNWLFPRCDFVCHHGGAGTAACGLRHGRPTVVVPFFGDQFFWGRVIAQRGAGPQPIPAADLTAEKLAAAFRECIDNPELKKVANQLGHELQSEGEESAITALFECLPVTEPGEWTEVIWEHQTHTTLVGWAPMRFSDTWLHPWGDASGRTSADLHAFNLPRGWIWESDWRVTVPQTGSDVDGWEYCHSGSNWHASSSWTDNWRRRRWSRTRRWVGPGSETLEMCAEYWENQRLYPIIGWNAPLDHPNYSADERGISEVKPNAIKPLPGWSFSGDWEVNPSSNDAFDSNSPQRGWQYAFDWHSSFGPNRGWWYSRVRRRKWTIRMVCAPRIGSKPGHIFPTEAVDVSSGCIMTGEACVEEERS